ncbi:MAG: hypothetical protein QXL94_08035, partial [Candidatus Parvarchaeum sp.]
LYRCGSSGWEQLPTYMLSVGNNTIYKAVSPSLSNYEIAKGYAFSINNTNITNEFVYEEGLPLNYQWNFTYDGKTSSEASGLPILFTQYQGNYLGIAYNISNSSFNGTYICTSTYYPTNLKAGEPVLIPAGYSFVVDYSLSNYCYAKKISPAIPIISSEEITLILISAIFVLSFIFVVILFMRKISKIVSGINKSKLNNKVKFNNTKKQYKNHKSGNKYKR